MKAYSLLLFGFINVWLVSIHAQSVSLQQVLNELDRVILQKEIYHSQREENIQNLKERLQHSSDI